MDKISTSGTMNERTCNRMVRAFVTCVQKEMLIGKGKNCFLDTDQQSALKIPEKLIELSKKLKLYHVAKIDPTEYEEGLDVEQKALDAFEDQVKELID